VSRDVSIEQEIGPQLRAHREKRELSLRELARRLEISPSALSQFETGKSRPSVATLYAIVTELGASLDELFGVAAQPATSPLASPVREPARNGPTPLTGPVQSASSRVAIELDTGVRWERLTSTPDPQADFLYVVYDVGGASCQGDSLIRHSGREYGLVLSGTLEVTVGFDRHELGPGDSISFDSTIPHCLRNVGSEPVRGVWFVTGRQGDGRAVELER
jgi:transcriptional regulator with XRE-family HTH domain